MKCIALALSLLVAGSTASAQHMEKWGYPDPDVFAKAALSLCDEQNLSVMLAARHRDQGRTREDVMALIPPKSKVIELRALDAYRENVEDVFDFPNIGTYSLMVFRAEVCRREVMAAKTYPRFETVRVKVTACEAQHGKEKSNALYACVRTVVDSM
jgi:hypothetical protein